VFDDGLIEHRRDGQVEQVAGVDMVFPAQLDEPAFHGLVQMRVGVVAAQVVHLLDKGMDGVVGQAVGARAEGVAGEPAKLLVGVVGPAAAQEAEILAEQVALLNLGQARQQFAAHEVAGGPEHDHRCGRRRRFGTHHVQGRQYRLDLFRRHCHNHPPAYACLALQVADRGSEGRPPRRPQIFTGSNWSCRPRIPDRPGVGQVHEGRAVRRRYRVAPAGS
jgi:hypothetical protein